MKGSLQAVSDLDFDRTVAMCPVPVLVEFWKPGCGHCRALMAELELLQDVVGSRVLIFTMNVEENRQIPAELEITSLPVLALYRNGVFARFIGGLGTWREIMRQLVGLESHG